LTEPDPTLDPEAYHPSGMPYGELQYAALPAAEREALNREYDKTHGPGRTAEQLRTTHMHPERTRED
jgi:hypothetical protein